MNKLLYLSILLSILLLTACGGRLIEPAPMPTPVQVNALPAAANSAAPASPSATPASAQAPQATSTQGASQIANPASKNCIDKGGKLEIRTAPDGGQTGICIFPNGKECEEWAFMRGQCSPEGESNPVYNNPDYQFSLSYPKTWTVQTQAASGKTPFSISFKNGQNILKVQVKRSSENTEINAAPPEGGEISQVGTLSISDQDVPFQVVKLEGAIKSAALDVKSGDLQFHFQVDNANDPEISTGILKEVQEIIKSLKIQ